MTAGFGKTLAREGEELTCGMLRGDSLSRQEKQN